MIYNLVVSVVFAAAFGTAVATILNTVAERLNCAGERWSRPAPRAEVPHNDRPEWYYREGER